MKRMKLRVGLVAAIVLWAVNPVFAQVVPGAPGTVNVPILLDDGDRKDEKEIVERWLDEFPNVKREPIDTQSGAVLLRKTGSASI